MCGELQLGTSCLRLGEKLAFAKYGSNNPASPLVFFFFPSLVLRVQET